jgi:hypothetical protein
LNAKKSEVRYPEFVYNHLQHVVVLAMWSWRIVIVLPSPGYIAATTREIDKPREILPK